MIAFTKTWLYRWLSQVQLGLRIFEATNNTHHVTYEKLRTRCRYVFEEYAEMKWGQVGLNVYNILDFKFFAEDWGAWLEHLRTPRNRESQYKSEMCEIRVRCLSLISEMRGFLAAIRLNGKLSQEEQDGEEYEVENHPLPELVETEEQIIPVEFCGAFERAGFHGSFTNCAVDNPTWVFSDDEEMMFYGLSSDRA